METKIGKKFEKNISLVLIDKVKFSIDNFTHQYDGVLNLLEEPEILDEFTLTHRDKKLYLGVNEELEKAYLDSKDEPFNETFQTDGGIQVESIQIGS